MFKKEQKDFRETAQVCESCKALGKDSHGDMPTAKLFYTISPDPERGNFGELDSEQQKKLLDRWFKNSLYEIRKSYKVYDWSKHYECNNAMNLHLHGIFIVDEKYHPYKRIIMDLSKKVHLIVGRKFNKCTVACTIDWIDNEDVYKYVNKENIFQPEHTVNISVTTIHDLFQISNISNITMF